MVKTKGKRLAVKRRTRIGTWVRLSDDTKRRVSELATKRDTTVSDYVRQAVIEKLERDDRAERAAGAADEAATMGVAANG